MRRIIKSMLICVIILLLGGCSAKDGKDLDIKAEETLASGDDLLNGSEEAEETEAKENEGTIVAEDYLAISHVLAQQMVEGNFDTVYETCSATMKMQISKDDLVTAWDTTVQGIGSYINTMDSSHNTSGDYEVVNIILEYENNGLAISFTYSKLGEIEGLWFSYSPLEIGLEVNDQFEETFITIGMEGDYPVDGILTLPKGIVEPPVAILVPGSGNHDQDESIGGNKPFRDIAHGLAMKGIASIRYKERILMYSNLAGEPYTIQLDSLDDASSAIRFALSSEQVDSDRIVIIGHSLGGMMAPKLATDHKEVAGIISLAGSSRKLEDIAVSQQEWYLSISEDYDDAQVEALSAALKEEAEKIKGLSDEKEELLLGYPSTYWRSLNQINIGELAINLTIPVMIAQGSMDWQVSSEEDYTQWMSILGGKENVTFHLYDNLNHLFMPVEDKAEDIMYSRKGSVDSKVIEDMADWIMGIK